MTRIQNALMIAHQEKELLQVVPQPFEPSARPKEEAAQITATVEVNGGLQHLYKGSEVRLTLFAVLLLASVTSATVYWNNRSDTAHTGAISESTPFEGTMRPVSQIKVTALEPGVVNRVRVHVGDTVQPGDVLVEMDNREAEMAVERAEVAYEAAQRKLGQLREELAQAESALSETARAASLVPSRQVRDSVQHAQAIYDQALVDHQRTEQLYKEGIVAKQVLDNAALQLKIAQDDLENARKGASANRKLQDVERRRADLLSQIGKQEQEQQLREAKLALRAALEHLANNVVRATSGGTLAEVPVEVGDQLIVGTPLVTIARIDRITVNVPVAASLVGSLRKFQQARITLPTMPPQHVLGAVRTISPMPSGNMTHNVEVEFDNPTGKLLVGQPAEVRFVFE